jgi:hypothetical protein
VRWQEPETGSIDLPADLGWTSLYSPGREYFKHRTGTTGEEEEEGKDASGKADAQQTADATRYAAQRQLAEQSHNTSFGPSLRPRFDYYKNVCARGGRGVAQKFNGQRGQITRKI